MIPAFPQQGHREVYRASNELPIFIRKLRAEERWQISLWKQTNRFSSKWSNCSQLCLVLMWEASLTLIHTKMGSPDWTRSRRPQVVVVLKITVIMDTTRGWSISTNQSSLLGFYWRKLAQIVADGCTDSTTLVIGGYQHILHCVTHTHLREYLCMCVYLLTSGPDLVSPETGGWLAHLALSQKVHHS